MTDEQQNAFKVLSGLSLNDVLDMYRDYVKKYHEAPTSIFIPMNIKISGMHIAFLPDIVEPLLWTEPK
jgi:hypothetical protein